MQLHRSKLSGSSPVLYIETCQFLYKLGYLVNVMVKTYLLFYMHGFRHLNFILVFYLSFWMYKWWTSCIESAQLSLYPCVANCCKKLTVLIQLITTILVWILSLLIPTSGGFQLFCPLASAQTETVMSPLRIVYISPSSCLPLRLAK